MNNEQFRRLLLDREKDKPPAPKDGAKASPQTGAGRLTLGNKKTSFGAMTPRTVKGGIGVDFARQVAERNATTAQQSKKFKASLAPKGSKLASGYQDRTLQRRDYEDDEKGARIKALEEQMKLGQLDPATFEALRDQITGGDVSATHLVKGLDRKLLERVRQGEDVMGGGQKEAAADVDDEFDRLEEIEVARVEREKTQKKGEMAAPPPIAGGKRTRDQILAELKAQRKAAADARVAARPELGSQFRDINARPRSGNRVERDEKGREVMITVDEDGNVKKKVRKVQPKETAQDTPAAPKVSIKFLDEGITIPTLKVQKKVEEKEESEDEGNIFEDVGTDYNPLGEDDDDDDDDDSTDEEGQLSSKPVPETKTESAARERSSRSASSTPSETPPGAKGAMLPPPVPVPSATSAKPENYVKRNYFKSVPNTLTTEAPAPNPFNDAKFLAAIKKASALRNVSFSLADKDGYDNEEDKATKEAKARRRAEMLAGNDRDLEDMDLGFGSSRFGDAEDAEEGNSKVKLSEWKGTGTAGDDDDDGQGQKGGGEKKKRSRKRKGDKNSAADVLGVLKRREESSK